jgi:hypothetical protein
MWELDMRGYPFFPFAADLRLLTFDSLIFFLLTLGSVTRVGYKIMGIGAS